MNFLSTKNIILAGGLLAGATDLAFAVPAPPTHPDFTFVRNGWCKNVATGQYDSFYKQFATGPSLSTCSNWCLTNTPLIKREHMVGIFYNSNAASKQCKCMFEDNETPSGVVGATYDLTKSGVGPIDGSSYVNLAQKCYSYNAYGVTQTGAPTPNPTIAPTNAPTNNPTSSPTSSSSPSNAPSPTSSSSPSSAPSLLGKAGKSKTKRKTAK